MPSTPAILTVDPLGKSITVNLTGIGPWYTTEAGSTAHSLPKTISESTTFYGPSTGNVTVSLKYNGQECASATGASRVVSLSSRAPVTITPQFTALVDEIGPFGATSEVTRLPSATKSRGMTLARMPNFQVKGVNMGAPDVDILYSANPSNYTTWWGSGWNWTTISGDIDRVANAGFNTLRIFGSYPAYLADPATYLSRFAQIVEYCRTVGLKLYYDFFNGYDGGGGTATNWGGASQTVRDAYIGAVMTGAGRNYCGDPLILFWGTGNEIDLSISANRTAVAACIATIRAADPVAPVATSVAGSATDINYTMIANVLLLSTQPDVLDVHLYLELNHADTFIGWPMFLDGLRAYTTLPFIIGEFGANNTTGTPDAPPQIRDESLNANYYKMIRKYAVTAGCIGFIAWQVRDDRTTSAYGLWNAAGTPRESLDVMLGYPSIRLDAVNDAIESAWTPVVIETFAKANASAVGTPALGAAATAALGTWGIDTKRGYLRVEDASNFNALIWEVNSNHVKADLDFEVQAGTFNVAVILSYVDTSNYYYLNCAWDGATAYWKTTINNAGSHEAPGGLASQDIAVNNTAVTAHRISYAARISFLRWGNDFIAYFNDKPELKFTDSRLSTATKVGIFAYSDTGWEEATTTPNSSTNHTWLRQFTASIPKRRF